MELKVTHIEATIPQLSVTCINRYGALDQTNNFIWIKGSDVDGNEVFFFFYADNFPLTEDTACQVVRSSIEDQYGTLIDIRHSAQPSISINGNEVTLTYTDCLLPLNGTNGTIIVKFINQL